LSGTTLFSCESGLKIHGEWIDGSPDGKLVASWMSKDSKIRAEDYENGRINGDKMCLAFLPPPKILLH
jgi:hypothetical protein